MNILYNSGDGEHIDLVELVSQPYIPADVSRIMKYSSRMATYLYKFMQLAALNPDWYHEVLSEGRKRFLENNRNYSFRDELCKEYGFNPAPQVVVTLPMVNQISVDQISMDLGV